MEGKLHFLLKANFFSPNQNNSKAPKVGRVTPTIREKKKNTEFFLDGGMSWQGDQGGGVKRDDKKERETSKVKDSSHQGGGSGGGKPILPWLQPREKKTQTLVTKRPVEGRTVGTEKNWVGPLCSGGKEKGEKRALNPQRGTEFLKLKKKGGEKRGEP